MAKEILLGQTIDGGNGTRCINMLDAVNPQDYLTLSQANALINGKKKGNYDASTNTPNLTTPAPGVVSILDKYVVSVAGSMFFGIELQQGDFLIACVDDPSSASDWVILQTNIEDAADVIYNPDVPGNWAPAPTDVGEALNQLAASLTGVKGNTKAGEILPGSFAASPVDLKASVVFAAPFGSADYSISIEGETPDSRAWTFESKTAAGFIIDTNSNQAITKPVVWIAVKHDDSVDPGIPFIAPVLDDDVHFTLERGGVKYKVRQDEVTIRSRSEVGKNVPSTISTSFAGNGVPTTLKWSGSGGGIQLVNFTFVKVGNTARVTYIDPTGSATPRRFIWNARISFTCSDPSAKFNFVTSLNGVINSPERSDITGRGSDTEQGVMVKGVTFSHNDYAEIFVVRLSGSGTLTVQSLIWELTAQGNLNG